MPDQNGSLDRLRTTAERLAASRRRIDKTSKLLRSSWDLLYLSWVVNLTRKAFKEKQRETNVPRKTLWSE